MQDEELARLLHLYPVHAVREHWPDIAGAQEDLITGVVATSRDEEIFAFCRDTQGFTKQRIVLLDNPDGLDVLGAPLLAEWVPVITANTARKRDEFYLPTVTYRAVVGPPYEEREFEFPWPVRVFAEGRVLQIVATIIEKNLTAYVPEGARFLGQNRNIDEGTVRERLGRAAGVNFELLDLHRGVKRLWAEDKIDAVSNKFKSRAGTKTEDMDSARLMKKDDPDAYTEAMASPMLKAVFRTLSDDVFPELFTIAPLDGTLSVTRYSKRLNEAENVVRAILAAN